MGKMRIKKVVSKTVQILFPLLLGGAILGWMYQDFNFNRVWQVLTNGMNYGWMLATLLFGVFSNLFRSWRWKLSLEPLNENPSTANCIYAVFIAYATNLIIPRLGEVSRCVILSKYSGTSFSKSLGTVVSERLIDTLCVGAITLITLVSQSHVFASFFQVTGTNTDAWIDLFTSANFYIVVICIIAFFTLIYFVIRNVGTFAKLRGILKNIEEGIFSLRRVKNIPLLIFYTFAIWFCYFMQLYLSFFCFDFSSDLTIQAGMVMFVIGSIAAVVPTPNGAGPWHFATITMLVLYGVGKEDAGIFALIVHGIQTFLLILLGIYGMAALSFSTKTKKL
ncbi:MAG: lysylphosphatidylglycerol synthase transmembrane domain-containing protein [Phocaeicola sp.]